MAVSSSRWWSSTRSMLSSRCSILARRLSPSVIVLLPLVQVGVSEVHPHPRTDVGAVVVALADLGALVELDLAVLRVLLVRQCQDARRAVVGLAARLVNDRAQLAHRRQDRFLGPRGHRLVAGLVLDLPQQLEFASVAHCVLPWYSGLRRAGYTLALRTQQ